jgi:hypothetical protein
MSNAPVDPADPTTGAATKAAQALDRIASFLRRMRRRVLVLAVAGLAGGAAIWWVVFQEAEGDARLTALILVGLALMVPAVALVPFARAIRGLVDLPQRVRESPEALRSNADEIVSQARAVGEAESRGPIRRSMAVIRLIRSASSTRGLVSDVLPGGALLSPWMWLWTSLAALGAVVEIVVGALALAWLLLA